MTLFLWHLSVNPRPGSQGRAGLLSNKQLAQRTTEGSWNVTYYRKTSPTPQLPTFLLFWLALSLPSSCLPQVALQYVQAPSCTNLHRRVPLPALASNDLHPCWWLAWPQCLCPLALRSRSSSPNYGSATHPGDNFLLHVALRLVFLIDLFSPF